MKKFVILQFRVDFFRFLRNSQVRNRHWPPVQGFPASNGDFLRCAHTAGEISKNPRETGGLRKFSYLLSFFFLALVFSCGGGGRAGDSLIGGSEAGNPPGYRDITGVVPSRSSSKNLNLLFQEVESPCLADQVVATDIEGEMTTANVASDCSFEMTVETGKAYSFDFELSHDPVATMIFDNNNSSIPENLMVVSDGENPINLGDIIFDGDLAFPEFEPSTQNDQDGDSVSDFEDADDDGDGVFDEEEEDCDADGIVDDYDLDTASCEEVEEESDEEEGDEEEETDLDADDDEVPDSSDAFPLDPAESVDTDGDGAGDNSDNCAEDANSDQSDGDADSVGDVCDNCSDDANTDQSDNDEDGEGDECDTDDDNDGVLDDGDSSGVIGDYYCPYYYASSCDDNCQFVANADQANYDYSGFGDACD